MQNSHAMMETLYPDPALCPFEVLRQMSASEKFAMCCSITETAINHWRRECEQRHPGIMSREVDFEFIRVHYGADLTEKVKLYLQERCSA